MTQELKHSLNVLKKHGLLLYPTDTIWGIGCDATNAEAVAKVYKLKQREESKALICLVSDIETLKTYVQDIPETVLELLFQAKRPTTIIYNNPILLANNLIANDNTIAIRLVSDGFAHELIKEFKKPIVSTSANISGMPAPKSFKEIHPDILKGVDYVVNLHDEKVDARPSTIIKLNLDGKIEVIRE
ncbi:L-threonylcarbamoyladenylate synthase [Hanstruepera ponticola]|uniref:L-threonylcarbamoyladenylate synthase n=1 Tax=Hanstruepera ponticola TaxID=2042995 RepID=UPI00177F8E6D|nr:L-threonylcarbamoyladenylate synthase [Hanstruepera ponticola]